MAQLEFPGHGIDGLPRLGESGDRLLALIAQYEVIEYVPGDVIVGRDVVVVGVDGRDIRTDANGKIGGNRARMGDHGREQYGQGTGENAPQRHDFLRRILSNARADGAA